MKITAKSSKTKEVFKPFTVTVEVTIESKEELDTFTTLGKLFGENELDISDYNYENSYPEYGRIFQKIAEQL